MKISVLTPTYNRSRTFLPECIESVQRQYGSVDYEHLIVDDRSSDETWSRLTALEDRRVIPIRSPKNAGPAHALNLALEQATGDFLLPLDDDDLLLPWSLQAHALFLEAHPQVDLTFGWAVLINADRTLNLWGFDKYDIDLGAVEYSDDRREFLDIMWKQNSVFNSTAVIRRSAVLSVGGWDENIRCQDWAMWLALLESGHIHKRNATYLSCYRIHSNQLTNQHFRDGTYDQDRNYLRTRFNRSARP